MTEAQAIKWYCDGFAGPSMTFDAEQSLICNYGYNELKLGLLRALRSRDAASIQAYLNSI